MKIVKHLAAATIAVGVLALITGVVYPLAVTGIAKAFFPHQADGSLVTDANGNVVGSSLIGQNFTSTKYFHGRPSAAGAGYDATASSGSNLGPTNAVLLSSVSDRSNASRAAGEIDAEGLVPVDAVTTSASGLDPHITLANAISQAPRVAQARGLGTDAVLGLVRAHTDERGFGFMGEPGVNVLALNLALDNHENAGTAKAADLKHGDSQVYGIISVVLILLILAVGGWYFAKYFVTVFAGQPALLARPLGNIESRLYRVMHATTEDQDWKDYAKAMLAFSLVSVLFTFAILRLQKWLPLNPLGIDNVRWDIAMSTAVSFASNTNWQAYAGESTMSFFSQMVALAFQNFVSVAVGIAVAFALIRGIARRDLKKGLGNFYTDLIRSTLYVLLPLALILAVFFVSQGVPQTFTGSVTAHTLEGGTQVIDLGPVASQEAIKMLGTNGGGFYNVNSAHPFENPNTITNFVELVSILLLPSAFIFAFGMMVLHPRHGKTLWLTITAILVLGMVLCIAAEQGGNPAFSKDGVNSDSTAYQAGGNMEGKDVRFGIYSSATWAIFTTSASNGSVNSMHDSYMPLGGMWAILMIMLGELIFGGVGAGLYSLIVLVVMTIFMAGLMVGRTPEYLGKKITGYEVKMAMLAIIIAEVSILAFSGIAMSLDAGRASISNPGPHGLTQVLYAYSSAVGNNGSAFAGLNAATLFYTLTQALAMFIGRYLYIIPVLALAGSLATKKIHPDMGAAFPVDGFLFGSILAGIIIIVAALTFFPALVLGPILEHVLLGVSF